VSRIIRICKAIELNKYHFKIFYDMVRQIDKQKSNNNTKPSKADKHKRAICILL
jgi:hypothetical protein